MSIVALLQYSPIEGSAAKNRERVREMVFGAKLESGTLLMLPELFSTGFSTDFKKSSAEQIKNLQTNLKTDIDFLKALASESGIWIMAGVLDAADGFGNYKNFLVSVNPEAHVVSLYQKIHPFSFSGEDKAFVSGIRPVFTEVGFLKIQNSICYDLRFPELYRTLLNAGVNALSVHANWPVSREEHWAILLRARAIENQAWVFAVNITGTLYGTNYFGGSRIISPKGEIVLEVGKEEGVFPFEVDEKLAEKWRSIFPSLKDRKKGVMIP
jgi:predicted amidohydrolase